MSGSFALIDVFSVLQLQFSLEPEPVAINCTAFNHNGNLLVTGAADGVIRLFGKVFFGGIQSGTVWYILERNAFGQVIDYIIGCWCTCNFIASS